MIFRFRVGDVIESRLLERTGTIKYVDDSKIEAGYYISWKGSGSGWYDRKVIEDECHLDRKSIRNRILEDLLK